MRSLSPLLAVVLVSMLSVAVAATALAQAEASRSATVVRPMTLTDAQVRGFFDAMDELHPATAGTHVDVNPSRPEAFAQALQVSGESEAVLRKHGFASTADFQQVAYNAAMAYGVVEQGGTAAARKGVDRTAAEQAAALEKMKEHMTPQQIEVLKAQVAAAMARGGSLGDVPEGNVELMTKYRDRMKRLGEGR